MKTIRHKDGTLDRVTNEQAQLLVAQGGSYATKKDWKFEVRDKTEREAQEAKLKADEKRKQEEEKRKLNEGKNSVSKQPGRRQDKKGGRK